jgi:hypothetical protein
MTHPLRVVIGGVPVDLELLPFQTVGDARDIAIRLTRNTGRPKDDWQAYDRDGRRLDMDAFADVVDEVYFCPHIGAGGSRAYAFAA